MVERCRNITEENVNQLIQEYPIPYAHVRSMLQKLTNESKARIAGYEAKLDTVLWCVIIIGHLIIFFFPNNSSSQLFTKQQNFGPVQIESIADVKINVIKNPKFYLGRVENIVGKGENAGYQHFLLFPQNFQKASFPGSLKVGIMW